MFGTLNRYLLKYCQRAVVTNKWYGIPFVSIMTIDQLRQFAESASKSADGSIHITVNGKTKSWHGGPAGFREEEE